MKADGVQRIGAHVSTAGGIQNAPARAAAIGCNVVQIFSDSPRVWQRREISSQAVQDFISQSKVHSIVGNVIHSLYLVNLATDKPELLSKSINSITHDMKLASQINSTGVVVHVGSYSDRGWGETKNQVIKSIATIIDKTPDSAVFLIENAAGQGGKVGSDLKEIKEMIETLKAPSRIGWCVDTCHAFAAGFRFRKQKGDRFLFEAIEEYDLLSALRVVHVNDSRDEFFSHRDRHANLGDGYIGTDELRAAVTHPMFTDKPMILEVPGIDDTGPDAENVRRLRMLLA